MSPTPEMYRLDDIIDVITEELAKEDINDSVCATDISSAISNALSATVAAAVNQRSRAIGVADTEYGSRNDHQRAAWSREEDAAILSAYQHCDSKQMSRLAATAQVYLPGRATKEIQDRYTFLATKMNELKSMNGKPSKQTQVAPAAPGDKKKTKKLQQYTPWSEADDKIVLDGVAALGHKWSTIASRLQNRTDDAVRNRYHRLVNRSTPKPPVAPKPSTNPKCKVPESPNLNRKSSTCESYAHPLPPQQQQRLQQQQAASKSFTLPQIQIGELMACLNRDSTRTVRSADSDIESGGDAAEQPKGKKSPVLIPSPLKRGRTDSFTAMDTSPNRSVYRSYSRKNDQTSVHSGADAQSEPLKSNRSLLRRGG